MRRLIKLTTRRELTAAVSQRYQTADRMGKKLILRPIRELAHSGKAVDGIRA